MKFGLETHKNQMASTIFVAYTVFCSPFQSFGGGFFVCACVCEKTSKISFCFILYRMTLEDLEYRSHKDYFYDTLCPFWSLWTVVVYRAASKMS